MKRTLKFIATPRSEIQGITRADICIDFHFAEHLTEKKS